MTAFEDWLNFPGVHIQDLMGTFCLSSIIHWHKRWCLWLKKGLLLPICDWESIKAKTLVHPQQSKLLPPISVQATSFQELLHNYARQAVYIRKLLKLTNSVRIDKLCSLQIFKELFQGILSLTRMYLSLDIASAFCWRSPTATLFCSYNTVWIIEALKSYSS